MDINQLNSDFGIATQLEFIAGDGGFPFIRISNRCASALISVYGAQVLSFKPVGEAEDLLFLSQQSAYTEGKAIRGGIPICWPWFGPDPKGLQRPNHGFVRNHFWQVAKTEAISDAETKVSLFFTESFKHEKTWQQPFTLTLEITVGNALTLNLITHNIGDNTFAITQAFHSYFRIGAINRVQIQGLEDCDYFDKLDHGAQKHQSGAVTIKEEVDRIYTNTDTVLVIEDAAFKRRIQIRSASAKTAVVWNPWIKSTQKTADLDNKAYKNFVCIEVGNIAFDLIQIRPGRCHHLWASFMILRE